MIKKVLVVDNDLDAHELVQDMLQISLEKVQVDQAMSGESFIKKIRNAPVPYDLILFNTRMKSENGADLLAAAKLLYPQVMDRVVLMADAPGTDASKTARGSLCIAKPFSLDYFDEVVKKVCCA